MEILIPGHDGILVPAVPAQNAWTLRFHGPLGHFADVILHVDINLAMRIGPHKFRYGPGDGNRMFLVIR